MPPTLQPRQGAWPAGPQAAVQDSLSLHGLRAPGALAAGRSRPSRRSRRCWRCGARALRSAGPGCVERGPAAAAQRMGAPEPGAMRGRRGAERPSGACRRLVAGWGSQLGSAPPGWAALDPPRAGAGAGPARHSHCCGIRFGAGHGGEGQACPQGLAQLQGPRCPQQVPAARGGPAQRHRHPAQRGDEACHGPGCRGR